MCKTVQACEAHGSGHYSSRALGSVGERHSLPITGWLNDKRACLNSLETPLSTSRTHTLSHTRTHRWAGCLLQPSGLISISWYKSETKPFVHTHAFLPSPLLYSNLSQLFLQQSFPTTLSPRYWPLSLFFFHLTPQTTHSIVQKQFIPVYSTFYFLSMCETLKLPCYVQYVVFVC